jgi:2-polyprenyl-3-methyl-5-hydroxy-6-metoxy-1,4-benzoquinol methylase
MDEIKKGLQLRINKMNKNLTEIPTYTRFADLKRLDFIRRNLSEFVSKNGSVLDVGCGNGIISLQLGKDGYAVHGIDMSEKSIANAKQNNPFSNVSFSVTDVEKLTSSGKRFDAIVCSEVLEHLHQPAGLLRQLCDILDDHGILFVTVPNGTGPRETLVTKPYLKLREKNNWAWRLVVRIKKAFGYSGTTIQSDADNLDHIQFFTRNQLTQLSRESGFKIQKIESSNFIDDIFPVSLLAKRSLMFQKLDSHLADFLPTSFTGGYLMVWRKS